MVRHGKVAPVSRSSAARSRASGRWACRQRSAERATAGRQVGQHRQHVRSRCPRARARRSRCRSAPWPGWSGRRPARPAWSRWNIANRTACWSSGSPSSSHVGGGQAASSAARWSASRASKPSARAASASATTRSASSSAGVPVDRPRTRTRRTWSAGAARRGVAGPDSVSRNRSGVQSSRVGGDLVRRRRSVRRRRRRPAGRCARCGAPAPRRGRPRGASSAVSGSVDHRGGPGVVGAFRHPLVGEQVRRRPAARPARPAARPRTGRRRPDGGAGRPAGCCGSAPPARRARSTRSPGAPPRRAGRAPARGGAAFRCRRSSGSSSTQSRIRAAFGALITVSLGCGKRVPVLRVGQFAPLVEAVEVAARHAAGLALVEGAAPAHPAVAEREDRLGLAEPVQVRPGTPDPPGLVVHRPSGGRRSVGGRTGVHGASCGADIF